MMQWQDVRKHHPSQWVLVEALESRSEGGYVFIDDMSVLETYGNNSSAVWDGYKAFKTRFPEKDIFFLHTDREELDIRELHPRFRIPMEQWLQSES